MGLFLNVDFREHKKKGSSYFPHLTQHAVQDAAQAKERLPSCFVFRSPS